MKLAVWCSLGIRVMFRSGECNPGIDTQHEDCGVGAIACASSSVHVSPKHKGPTGEHVKPLAEINFQNALMCF